MCTANATRTKRYSKFSLQKLEALTIWGPWTLFTLVLWLLRHWIKAIIIQLFRFSSVVALFLPEIVFGSKITMKSFRYASLCL